MEKCKVKQFVVTVDLGCNELNSSELKFCYNQGFVTNTVLYNSFNVISIVVQKIHEANSRPKVYVTGFLSHLTVSCLFPHTYTHPSTLTLIFEFWRSNTHRQERYSLYHMLTGALINRRSNFFGILQNDWKTVWSDAILSTNFSFSLVSFPNGWN